MSWYLVESRVGIEPTTYAEATDLVRLVLTEDDLTEQAVGEIWLRWLGS